MEAMLASMAAPFVISPPGRRELMTMANSRSARSEDGRRARIILDLGRGLSLRAIGAGERCSVNTVGLWRERFREDRLAGLYSRHRGRQPTPGREKLEARIIDFTLHRKASGGATQWSTRSLAKELGTTQTHVSQIWRKAGLQPHRLRRTCEKLWENRPWRVSDDNSILLCAQKKSCSKLAKLE